MGSSGGARERGRGRAECEGPNKGRRRLDDDAPPRGRSHAADRLEFEVRRSAPGAHAGRRYHNPTEELGYTPFFADFGPLNLGKVRSGARGRPYAHARAHRSS